MPQRNTPTAPRRRQPQRPRKRPGRKKFDIRRLFSPVSIISVVIVLALVGLIIYANNRNTSRQLDPTDVSGSLLAVTTPTDLDQELLEYTGMLISFNPSRHIPNWVSWELTADEVQGEEPRTNAFMADPSVKGCADPKDYRHSGYDRGHMVPAGDMKWSDQAMKESFFMTNICPQDNKLNTGAWRKLEEKCRQWAIRDSAIVIVCGPVPTDPVDTKIGTNQVWVPRRFFKAIISPYTNPPRGIAFIMPNSYVKGGIQEAAVSIDEVERITGYDLFPALPDDIEDQIETQCNFSQWSY